MKNGACLELRLKLPKCTLHLPKIFVRIDDLLTLEFRVARQNINPVIPFVTFYLLGVKFGFLAFDF